MRIVLLSLLLLGAGCATQQGWSRYEMCFGLSADSGRTRISEEQWQAFRDEEIVGRFPDGFTIYQGNGYWRADEKTYSEPSEILMVVAPDTGDTQKRLDDIASAYVRRFHQDAVLQTKSKAEVDFHNHVEPVPAGSK